VREREIRALQDSIGSLKKIKQALILSNTNEDNFKIDGVPVKICSVAEWLLNS
jgi:hypothetical protein